MLSLGHQSLEGHHHRLVEVGVLHVALVDEEILMCRLLACRLWFAYESCNLADARFNLQWQQILVEAFAEYFDDALACASLAQVEHLCTIVVEGEVYLWINQHDALKCGKDVVQLCGIRLQEFSAGRNIIEDVFHREVAAYRTRDCFLTNKLGTRDRQVRAYLIVGSACLEFHLCHCGNRGQCLAAKSHRVQVEQVAGLADF